MTTILGPLTLGSTGGGNDSVSMRQALIGFTANGLGQIRITLTPPGAFPMWFDNVSIAIVGSATAPNCQLTPTPVTFTGNAGPIIALAGISIVSDWITFTGPLTTDTLLVIMDYNSLSPSSGASNGGTVTGDTLYSKVSSASYNLATVTGYTSNANSVNNVTLVETQAGGGSTVIFIPNNNVQALQKRSVQAAERSYFLPPSPATVGISGIAFTQPIAQVLIKKIIDSPTAFAPPLGLISYYAGGSDEYPLTKSRARFQDSSSGWSPQPITAATVGISGIAWMLQFEQFVAKKRNEPPPLAYVAPIAVTVGVSGIAWQVAVQNVQSKPAIQTPQPAWDAQPPFAVGISGVAWMRQFEQFVVKKRNEPPAPAWDPQFVLQQTVGVSGMAWWSQVENHVAKQRNEPPTPGYFAAPGVAIGKLFIAGFDGPFYVVRASDVAAQVVVGSDRRQ